MFKIRDVNTCMYVELNVYVDMFGVCIPKMERKYGETCSSPRAHRL